MEEVYAPVEGERGAYTVMLKQRFKFSASGKGASLKMKDQVMERAVATGIKLIKEGKTTLKSVKYAKDDTEKKEWKDPNL
jgi:hypothetical protein